MARSTMAMTANFLGAAAGLLAALYLLVGLLLWLGQESLIFHPKPLDEGDRTRLAEHELATRAEDGTMLSGWILPGARQKQPLLIYIGGNAEEISASLEMFADRLGLPAGGFNYRGYGDSEGRPTAANLRADALAVFDALVAAAGTTAEQTVVIGRSLGTHMAAHVAANRTVGRLVLVTPFDRLSAVAGSRYPIFPVRLMLRHEFDNVAESTGVVCPALIVAAGFDRVVPRVHSKQLAAQWDGGTLDWAEVAGAAHHDIYDFAHFWHIMERFISTPD